MTEAAPALSRAPGRALRIGVLALQGGVREHAQTLEAAGVNAVPVRRPRELEDLDGLVLPGGESTTMDKLLRAFDVYGPLQERIRGGLPVYGSCAGMILLADHISDPARDLSGAPQQTLGGLDIEVRRNAFGRQRESFETLLNFQGLESLPSAQGDPGSSAPVHAVFIRAPWVEKVGGSVRVLAQVPPQAGSHAPADDFVARIVAVRSENLLATSFHPEVTGESRIHELFIQMIRGEA